jgi:viroplasmin and RNaseH domain-containing protein
MQEKLKYYVVLKGVNTGIFHDIWDNVLPLVKGYPDSIYKKFMKEEDARQYYGQYKGKKIKIGTVARKL